MTCQCSLYLSKLDPEQFRADIRAFGQAIGRISVAYIEAMPGATDALQSRGDHSCALAGGTVLFSLLGFIVFYSTLAVVDVWLMTRYIRMGPEEALGRHLPSSTGNA